MTGVHWYIARTPPAREPLAAHILERRGFPVYSPMRVVWRRQILRNGRRRTPEKRLQALFQGYVFVGLGAETPDGEVLRDTPCVTSLVTIDGINPAEIRESVVTELRSRFGCVTSGPQFHRWITGKPFGVGDLVELVGEVPPPLRGIPFRVEEIRGRSAVICQLLGIRITVGLDNLEARV